MYLENYRHLTILDIFKSEIQRSLEILAGASVAKQVGFGALLVLVGLVLIQLNSSEQ